MDWVRGEAVGHGSFGKVNLAIPRKQSTQSLPLMVVKSSGVYHSETLKNEKLILDELKDCPEIISCFGDSYTFENGEKLYNVLLEYASGGSLSDKLKNSGDHKLSEFEVRRHTKALLRGLRYIHASGYVHCDIKLQNILLGQDGNVKIADFGLAKRVGYKKDDQLKCELRGTPLYMSPEMVNSGEQSPPADMWALGCVVAEMVTGIPAWRCSNVTGLLMAIGAGEESPEIPGKLSEEGKDFLGKCFVKDHKERWTAEMLLNHPFVSDHDDDDSVTLNYETSPRCPFDFPDWVSDETCSITSLPSPAAAAAIGSWSTSPAERIRRLVSGLGVEPEWSDSSWVNVR